MSRIVQARQTRPWLQPDWFFNMLPYGSEQKRCLSVLHGFTDKVLRVTAHFHAPRVLSKESWISIAYR